MTAFGINYFEKKLFFFHGWLQLLNTYCWRTYKYNTQIKKILSISDPNVDEIANAWASKVESRLKTVLGYTRVFLDKSTFHPNPLQFESNLANLVTDAMLYSVSIVTKDGSGSRISYLLFFFLQILMFLGIGSQNFQKRDRWFFRP